MDCTKRTPLFISSNNGSVLKKIWRVQEYERDEYPVETQAEEGEFVLSHSVSWDKKGRLTYSRTQSFLCVTLFRISENLCNLIGKNGDTCTVDF